MSPEHRPGETTETTTCPKCGHQQPGGDECLRCGVFFAKLRPRPEAPTPGPVAPQSTPPAHPVRPVTVSTSTSTSGRGGGNLLWLLLLFAAVLVGGYFETQRRARADEAAEQPVAGTEALGPSPSATPQAEPSAPPPAPAANATPGTFPGTGEPTTSEPPWPPPPEAPKAALPPGQGGPRPSYRYPHRWLQDSQGYRTATQNALEEQRLVTLYVYTDWCPYCRELERGLLTTSPVRDCLARTVKVRVNPEHGPNDRAVADLFGVTGYPSLFFYDPATGNWRKLPRNTDSPTGRRLMTPGEFVENVCEPGLG